MNEYPQFMFEDKCFIQINNIKCMTIVLDSETFELIDMLNLNYLIFNNKHINVLNFEI